MKCDWTGSHAALQRPCAPKTLESIHGIWERDHGRHVRAHAGHGPMDAGSRMAQPNFIHGWNPGETGSKANTPDTQSAAFDFDDLRVQWQHRTYGHPVDPEYPWGATLYGSKGTLRLSVKKWHFKPVNKKAESLAQDVEYELDQYPEDRTEKDLEKHVSPAVRNHMRDFMKCVESRERPVSDIEQGHISAASCILANVAMKLGRTLQWDPTTHSVIGDDEANRLLQRPYRKPWLHPDPGSV